MTREEWAEHVRAARLAEDTLRRVRWAAEDGDPHLSVVTLRDGWGAAADILALVEWMADGAVR